MGSIVRDQTRTLEDDPTVAVETETLGTPKRRRASPASEGRIVTSP